MPDIFEIAPDLKALRTDVARLPRDSQLAFAVYCAERVLTYYGAFAIQRAPKDASKARTVLDRLWQHLEGDRLGRSDVRDLRAIVESLCLEETPYSEHWDGAVDALGAIDQILDF